MEEIPSITFAIAGDKGVGKSCLLLSYATDEFLTTYTPTTWEHYEGQVEVEDNSFKLEFWDLSAEDKDENVRKFAISKSEAFVVAFNLLGELSSLSITLFIHYAVFIM